MHTMHHAETECINTLQIEIGKQPPFGGNKCTESIVCLGSYMCIKQQSTHTPESASPVRTQREEDECEEKNGKPSGAGGFLFHGQIFHVIKRLIV